MRKILTISMPEKEKIKLEKRAKDCGKTVSAYVLHAVRMEQSFITEDELVRSMKKAIADHKAGKTKKLNSLRDLM